MGNWVGLLNNLDVWTSGSLTVRQFGSLTVVLRGIDGIERSSLAVVASGMTGSARQTLEVVLTGDSYNRGGGSEGESTRHCAARNSGRTILR